jgi:hypothetical protein
MNLETVSELVPGTEYTFRIRRASMLFSYSGKVIWNRRRSTLASSSNGSLNLYRCGVSFLEPVSLEALEFLIHGG